MKIWTAALIGTVICVSGLSYRQSLQNDALRTIVKLSNEEIRILTYELNEEKNKPSYEQGQRDLLIKLGGPTTQNSYRDGWDDAVTMMDGGGWTNGYHAAIQQFGYKLVNTENYLAPEPKSNETAKVSMTK